MRILIASLLVTFFAFPAAGAEKAGPIEKDTRVLQDAAAVVEKLTATPDQSIPQSLLQKSECILVFPGMKKGAFIVGGKGGRGVASCRDEHGRMGSPAFYHVGGASIGFQWGGSSTDVVLLIMNPEGMKHLVGNKFTIGADASAAAGPVGRTTTAQTDAQMHAEMLSWSRTRGLFAGVALDGSVVDPWEEANARMYGTGATAREILIKHEHKTQDPAALRFVEVVRKHTARPAKKEQ